MTGLNHGLVGGAIAHYLPLPIALPLALASHFLMDALPHFGMPHHDRDRSKFWIAFFTIDALATFSLAAYAILTRQLRDVSRWSDGRNSRFAYGWAG